MTTIYQRTFVPEPTEDDYIPLPTRSTGDGAAHPYPRVSTAHGNDEKSIDESQPYHYIIPEGENFLFSGFPSSASYFMLPIATFPQSQHRNE
ncbi:hypothetical protein ABW19_dt0203473 [Dactylella cylindrospora]|nr:hypothetical protein ABW19_dt0203473 [Dactylella cylindrospora]